MRRKGYRSKRRVIEEVTFTKRKVNFLLFAGVIGAFTHYILAAFERDPVADLGKAWLIEIVATILGYLLKSYSETKQEEKQKLDNFKAECRYNAEMAAEDDDPGKKEDWK